MTSLLLAALGSSFAAGPGIDPVVDAGAQRSAHNDAHQLADAAAATGADLLRASALSADHALGSSAPWVQPFHQDLLATGASFHPNRAGMTAIARALGELLLR
ncbi:hypothetical protein FM103_04880 [Corynebacterium xerosis]|nr:hypothetical protein FM103_04880 [Corynebacterium xerosis]